MLPVNRIACWMSEKKAQKINWTEFEEICKKYGFDVFKVRRTIYVSSFPVIYFNFSWI